MKLTPPWISKESKVRSAHCRDHQDKHASCISQTFTRAVLAAGGAGSPRHLRTLMAPLVDLLLETQNAGEVDDPSPGGTSGCHLLSGCILHHFHIRVFPRPLSAREMRNWQVNTIFKVFKVSHILPRILEKEVASMCQICTYWGRGDLPTKEPVRSVCSPGYCFSDTSGAQEGTTGHGSAQRPAGAGASVPISPRLIHSALHPPAAPPPITVA